MELLRSYKTIGFVVRPWLILNSSGVLDLVRTGTSQKYPGCKLEEFPEEENGEPPLVDMARRHHGHVHVVT